MTISQLNRNMAMLQMEQTDNSKDTREALLHARSQKQEQKLDALANNEEASNIRADAQTEQAGYSAAAAGLGVAAAVCACFPPIGTVIGAILGAVAAVLALVGALQAKAKEEQAGMKEEQAGLKEIMAERQQTRIDDLIKDDEDRDTYVDQFKQQLQELKKQEGQTAKF